MFSAASERPRTLPATPLRGAGLTDKNKDKDATMSDGTHGTPGGGKRTGKVRSHRYRASDAIKNPGSSSRASLLATRLSASSPSTPISIRGAAKAAHAVGPSRHSRRTLDLGPHGAPSAAASSPLSADAVEVWREFVQKRWNPQAQFLNLESIASDETLKKLGNRPNGVLSVKEAAVIFKLASKLVPEVLSISLANNGLSHAQPLQTLHHYLPGLRNLSLANNNLRSWRDVDYISSRRGKFLHLKEIVMTGNPLREVEISNGYSDKYKSAMLRRLPTLELLDSEAITRIDFDAPGPSTTQAPGASNGPTSFPVQMAPGFIAPGVEGFVAEFLTKFFTMYDSSRASLVDIYGPNATFSFSANTSVPPRARIKGYYNTMPNQKRLEWTPYITMGSRNLNRVNSAQRARQTLYTGAEEIVKKIVSIPGTKHDITAHEKFVVDALPIQGVLPGTEDESTVLFITVHGQFEEVPSHGIRSFDRSFTLAPAAEGSRAKLAGWPVVILSDLLVIRVYSGHEAWAPGPIRMPPLEGSAHASMQPPQPTNANMPPQQQQAPVIANDPVLGMLSESRRMLVYELSARTGLNATYSVQCLDGNNWEPQKALANFEQVRASIPPEAFL